MCELWDPLCIWLPLTHLELETSRPKDTYQSEIQEANKQIFSPSQNAYMSRRRVQRTGLSCVTQHCC